MSTLIKGLPPGEAVEKSYRKALVATDQERATFVLETLGARVATAGVGLSDARQVRAWASGASKPRGDAAERLRVLFRIAFAVASVYGPDTAAAFVRGATPGLDDESVIAVLARDNPSAELEKRLMGVVRDFLAG